MLSGAIVWAAWFMSTAAPPDARLHFSNGTPLIGGGRLGIVSQRLLKLTAAVANEGDWYVARCLDVEVTSQGKTVKEALASLREALELYFEDMPVPERLEPPTVTSIEVEIPLSA